ncbi:DUF7856 family protein [Halobellus rufus]|uniref:DUF7856 family protein n=1 Tax=Halobellus rufus TaxID=1448860 RepID=UPI000678D0B4|nr:hypothetical protein [Halobellus rufus]
MSGGELDSGVAVAADAHEFTLRLPSGRVEAGPVVDLTEPRDSSDVTAAELRRAVQSGCPVRPDALAVHASPPGRAHAHVAQLGRDTTVRTRSALAAAAADLGVGTPHDADLADALCSLRSLSPAPIDDAELREARRRAAAAGAETDRLRERVATVRGRVTALREAAGDDSGNASAPAEALGEAEAALSDVTRQLSEAATERVAAAQRLDLLERRARTGRDERNARIRLEDRIGNCRRRVRAARVAAVSDEFRAARDALRPLLPAADADGPDAPELLDALAVARIAPIRAPLVLAAGVADALGGPDAAFERLGAPLLIR